MLREVKSLTSANSDKEARVRYGSSLPVLFDGLLVQPTRMIDRSRKDKKSSQRIWNSHLTFF